MPPPRSPRARNPAAAAAVTLDRTAIDRIVAEQRGIPFPVLRSSRTLEQYLASARIVENTVAIVATEETAWLAEPAPLVAAGGR